MNSTPWPGSRRRVEGQYAVKLGWKLAFAAGSASRRPEPEALLESYNVERRPVAQHVLAATRALYWAEAGTDPVARFARSVLAPWAAPAIALTLQQRRLRSAAALRTVSQLRMHDRHSPLSVDGTPHAHGRPRPGDRLPDRDSTLLGCFYDCTNSLQRQDPRAAAAPAGPLQRRSLGHLLQRHRLPDWSGHGVLLIRSYLGFRFAVTEEIQITNWLAALTAPNRGQFGPAVPSRPRR
jgi:hypothetical protein